MKKRKDIKRRNTKAGGEFGGVNRPLVRLYFLAALQKECPKVLQILKNDVLMQYTACEYVEEVYDWTDVSNNPNHESLRDALIAWGQRYHIDEPFIYDIALRTLRFWHDNPAISDREPLSWHFYNLYYYRSGAAKPYTDEEKEYLKLIRERENIEKEGFTVKGWNPFKSSRREYNDYILYELEKYLNQIESEMFKEDITITPEIRKPYHFNWLALHLAANKKPKDLAGDMEESTIRKALKKTAAMIGIKLPGN